MSTASSGDGAVLEEQLGVGGAAGRGERSRRGGAEGCLR
eukprot:SAG25_NODE_13164_length_270_cov_1.175439_1_plen_38_part_10